MTGQKHLTIKKRCDVVYFDFSKPSEKVAALKFVPKIKSSRCSTKGHKLYSTVFVRASLSCQSQGTTAQGFLCVQPCSSKGVLSRILFLYPRSFSLRNRVSGHVQDVCRQWENSQKERVWWELNFSSVADRCYKPLGTKMGSALGKDTPSGGCTQRPESDSNLLH